MVQIVFLFPPIYFPINSGLIATAKLCKIPESQSNRLLMKILINNDKALTKRRLSLGRFPVFTLGFDDFDGSVYFKGCPVLVT